MSGTTNLAVLGVPIAVKPGADTSRIQEAIDLVQKRYEAQVARSRGVQGKDVLLTFLAFELADELLQLKRQQNEYLDRVQNLLNTIQEAK
ncbi:MAG: cell division protein ZapA [Desulfovibrio sp.]|nr:cell division protein ZapA [Desulfovibrio sp.]